MTGGVTVKVNNWKHLLCSALEVSTGIQISDVRFTKVVRSDERDKENLSIFVMWKRIWTPHRVLEV
jgi:hypothetical protein